jgi:hypothetical protein
MSAEDKVKLLIGVAGIWRDSLVVSRGEAEAFRDSLLDVSVLGFVTVKGRLNDADGNSVSIFLRKEEVIGIEIIELNNQF